jgi:fatty-acyl-CoA synthase
VSRFVEKLLASASGHGQVAGIVTGEPNRPVRHTWAQVHEASRRGAGALMRAGVRRGAAIAVLTAAPLQAAVAAQAVWLSGGSVTMLQQPTPRTDINTWVQDTFEMLRVIGADVVLLGEPFEVLSSILEVRGMRHHRISELDGAPISQLVHTTEDDIALLQLTSGSTADPKVVMITHGNLISTVAGLAQRTEVDVDNDVMVSWLPVFHDMGMVGYLCAPMAFGIELIKITPMDFLANPLIWPELITKYKGTITSAPNSAYAMMGRRLAGVDVDETLDLSTVRIMMSGAEQIDSEAVIEFTTAAERFGLHPRSMVAAYGMAESTVTASFEINRGLEVDVVDAYVLETEGRAVSVAGKDLRRGDNHIRGLARLGSPIAGVLARVVDASGAALADGMVGEIQLCGEGISRGYLTVDGPVNSRDVNGWLPTGDLGYLVDGQIVVCGRLTEVIVMGGRSIYPTEVERAASSVEGVRLGNVAAIRIAPDTAREQFAVVVESSLADQANAAKKLEADVLDRVVAAVDARPQSVIVVPRGSLPKTTSGKLRRRAATARFGDRRQPTEA